jgi:hypothetical protein
MLQVAVKQLNNDLARSDVGRTAFRDEMYLSLSSSRFCQNCAVCYGWTEMGKYKAPCLVMKRYDQSLMDLLQQHGEAGSPRTRTVALHAAARHSATEVV